MQAISKACGQTMGLEEPGNRPSQIFWRHIVSTHSKLYFRELSIRMAKTLAHRMLGAVAFLVLAVVAHGQGTGSISGTVKDGAGALIPGAKIVLINEASKATRPATSNGEGFFNFIAVQPDTYTVRVTKAGFESWEVDGVEVHPGDSLEIPKIALKIGQVTESVVVTATTAGVTLDSPEHSTLVTSADLERLSTAGRDALELVSMLPGFTINAGTTLQNTGPDYYTTAFGSGNFANMGANGAAPQSGLVNIVTDGVQVIDPGDMGSNIANVNMDQVQEVKVQTANFGADEAKGPIVVNAVGKSGGTAYHGSLYGYARNHIFNSNDWLSNDSGTPNANGVYVPITKTQTRYFYPGATFGGPIKIPGTHFNENKHLAFWVGYEQYVQKGNTNGTFGGPTFGFIPTPAMLGGDMSYLALGQAFNVSPQDLADNCNPDWGIEGVYANLGGDCTSPAGSLDEWGNAIPAYAGTLPSGALNVAGGPAKAGHIPASSINPSTAAFAKFYPAINRTAQPTNNGSGYASDGFNWVQNVLATNNGLQLHSRVDENISDSLKLYGVFNWEKVNTQNPLNNIYYNPPDTIPFPTPLDSNGYSDYASLNLTKIVSNSTTNELVLGGIYFLQPEQFQNRSLALDTGTPWAAAGYSGGVFKIDENQLPRIYSYETFGLPNFSFGYVPPGSLGQFLRKAVWDVGDNLTRIYRTHTIKAGVYAEQTRNNNVGLGSDLNSTVGYNRWAGCLVNQTTPSQSYDPTTGATAYIAPGGAGGSNTFADFLMGCPGSYNQSTKNPTNDMYFNTLEFYGTDEWKITSKLTLTYGIRISHLSPWTAANGIGEAVWDPTKYNPIQPGIFSQTVTSDTKTWPGISWHQLDPSIPIAGVPTTFLFYMPRLGMAYDLYGNGKTVLRGGWGVYRSRDSNGVAGGALSTAIDLVDHGMSGNKGCTLDQLMNGYLPPATAVYPPASAPAGQVVGCGFYGFLGYNDTAIFNTGAQAIGYGSTIKVAALDPKDREQPVTYNYNFTLDQQLPHGATFEVAYVGNQSTDLATQGNLQNHDVIPLGALWGPDPLTGQTVNASSISSVQQADYRPYPNYTAVNVPEHTNWANYNAMQVSLNKQRGSLVFGVNYTWAKAMGVRGNWDTGNIADPVNAHHDYGIVSFDRPQTVNFTYSYQEGKKFHGNRQLGWALNDWEASGITTVMSGPDIAIYNGANFGFSASAGYVTGTAPNLTQIGVPVGAGIWLGSTDYSLQPSVTCDPRLGFQKVVGKVRQYANGNCFAMPALGTQGWWNLPDVRGPLYEKSDLSVYKDVHLTDRQSMQFRASGFNFLNHPIPSFTNNDTNALNLAYADPKCNLTTGSGCFTSQTAALTGMALNNPGFGLTSYKMGQRILEFGFKYNF
jgi:hypothetical protein